ncbi:MAG: hypothetical protein HYS70_07160 [Nitrospinae bacterium]|nr:hypothetical protein [Nitrospinota bacterium]
MYTQQQLQEEFFWREPKNYRKVNRFDRMPPYPLIYEEKASKWRKGVAQVDPELKKKMKAHNERRG